MKRRQRLKLKGERHSNKKHLRNRWQILLKKKLRGKILSKKRIK